MAASALRRRNRPSVWLSCRDASPAGARGKSGKRIAIIGGGYIALEFAGIFHGLGSEVTVVVRSDKVLRGFDDDLPVGTQVLVYWARAMVPGTYRVQGPTAEAMYLPEVRGRGAVATVVVK